MNIKLIKNFVGAFTGSASVAVINFITIPLLLTGLGINGYGELSIILTSFLVTQILTSLQPWQAFIKFWFQSESNKEKLLTFSLIADVFSCLLGAIIIYFTLTSPVFSDLFFIVSNQVAFVFSLALLFNPFSFFIGICRVNDKFLFLSFCESLRSFIRLLGALTIINHGDLLTYSLFFMASNLLVLLFASITMRHQLLLAIIGMFRLERLDFLYFNRFIKFSYLVSLKSIVDLPVQHLDKFLVSSILGNSSVAIYDIAKRINQGFGVFINVVNQIYYPVLVKKIEEQGFNTSLSYVVKISVILVFFGVGMLVTSYVYMDEIYYLYKMVFDLSYSDFKFNFIYTSVFLISSCFLLIHVFFQASGFVGKDVFFLTIANIMYLVICIFGLSAYGVEVIIIAYTLQIFLVLSFKIFILKKNVNI
ncbi:lipopolysaccharide biosynthesis protein [Vibrio sp. 10N.286.52.F8]|uniref:lipopolysaccharide biosynthesis protein n=1 Tax=Vibrio sp. 10N.286.52.F8 TaxID=3229716 RepID=UPI003551DEE3